ncbi:MAG: nicotinate-nucleotide--dimethylbenzimidazole phosphoribosyltransferase [Pikeienuella sp.]
MLGELTIAGPVPGLVERVQARLDGKTKPLGALGRVEEIALAIAAAQGVENPVADPATCLLFAGDHGIVAEGVSAWPQEVTARMVETFLSGGAAASVLARSVGAELRVLDAGVATPIAGADRLARAEIRAGTRNAATEDALTPGEVAQALRFGAEAALAAVRDGARVIALGEMGIGNTATAALLASAVAGIALDRLVGPGAGQTPEGLAHKRAVLARALARRPGPLAPQDALAAFGGLEIAAMAGALIGGASAQAVVLVDGFIATAAALVALTARPEARRACLFAHRSAELGHAALLEHLEAQPLLGLEMRLGEGTGALLAVPLLRAAAAVLADMASLDAVGISARAEAAAAPHDSMATPSDGSDP